MRDDPDSVQCYGVKGKVLTTRAESAGAGLSKKSVTVQLAQLAPSTTYPYRVVAEDSAGRTRGRWRTFTTRAGTVEAPARKPARGRLLWFDA